MFWTPVSTVRCRRKVDTGFLSYSLLKDSSSTYSVRKILCVQPRKAYPISDQYVGALEETEQRSERILNVQKKNHVYLIMYWVT